MQTLSKCSKQFVGAKSSMAKLLMTATSDSLEGVRGGVRSPYSSSHFKRGLVSDSTAQKMAIVTLIRHGESQDNVRNIWAGWKDAPLTELGQKQAYSLGHSLSSTPFTHIYTSDLKRAHSTAQHVLEQQPSPHPPLTITPLLREQHFGVAEGYAWVMSIPEGTTREAMYEQKVFPVLDTRQEKFPEGESLDDIALRAEAAVRECILPHVGRGQGDGDEGAHIAIASHGLCISEVVAALVRLDPEADKTKSYRGLKNTAWARVEVNQRPGDAAGLEVKVVKFNVDEHLDDMKDIPSRHENEDGASAEARAYFGGGAA